MTISYNCGSRGYLKRARKLLDEGTQESLFHAAFELRCGIESRLQEYLEVQDQISNSKKEGWQIAKLAKGLESAFKLGDKIVELEFLELKTGQKMPVYFTPVTARLRKQGERLGDYLHAMKKARDDADAWWKETRKNLEDTCEQLSVANKGTLLGPPLTRPNGAVNLHIELGVYPKQDDFMLSNSKAGFRLQMNVCYLVKLPESV